MVLGRPFWEIFLVPSERVEVQAEFRRLAVGDGASTYENYWLMRDGQPRWIEWRNTITRTAAGRLASVVCAGIDVTDRKRAEEALARLEVFEKQRGVADGSAAQAPPPSASDAA